MAGKNESTMKWKVDVAQLKSAMQDAKRSISLANAEFKNATAGIGKWQDSITGVEAKIKQLNKTNESQKTVLSNLEKQYSIVAKEMGEDSAEAQRLKVQIENQQAAIKKTDSQLATYNDKLGELKNEQKAAQSPMAQLSRTIDEQETELADLKKAYANATLEYGKNSKEAKQVAGQIDKLSSELAENKSKMNEAEKAADELDKSIDEAGDSAKEAANGGFTVMKGAMADLVSVGIQKAVEGMKQLASAAIDLGKQSLASYASQEQLIGGVQKLYGTGGKDLEEYAESVGKSVEEARGEWQKYQEAQELVMKNANEAYKTSGMSANQYMETATSFSAALINSLGGDTVKAAEVTDVAMRAMSDNVNTFGSSAEDVQNAIMGISKQNYSMLDNLKLGYGGTKTEMQRLMDDANEYAKSIGQNGDLTMDSFADQIQALQLIQEKQQIAGTTAKEAASTMEGSVTMAQAAWENLLGAFAGGDKDAIDTAWDNFVNACKDVISNWLPRIKEMVGSAGEFINEKLHELFPEVMAVVDPIIAYIRDELIPAVKEVIKWVLDNAPLIVGALAGIGAAMVAMNVVTTVQGIVKAFKGWKLATEGMTLAQRALNLVMKANPIGLVVSLIVGLVAAFITLWNTSEDFRNFWIGVWENIKEFAGNAIEGVKEFFQNAWTKITEIWNAATGFFSGIWTGIKNIFSVVVSWFKDTFKRAWNAIKIIWNAVKGYFQNIWNGIVLVFSVVATWFKNMFQTAWDNIKNIWNAVTGFFQGIWDGIKNIFSVVGEWFRNIFQGALTNIKNIWNTVKGYFQGIWNGIVSVFNGVGAWFKNIFQGAWNNIKGVWSAVTGWFGNIWTGIKDKFNSVGTWFKDIFQGAWTNIKNVFSGWGDFFGGLWNTIKDKFTSIGTNIASAISGAVKSGINGVISMIENTINGGVRLINGAIGLINKLPGVDVGKIGELSLPRLARGAVLTGARAVIAGEDGAEAIVPLERNKEWIAKVAQDMLQALNTESLKNAVSASARFANNGGVYGGAREQTVVFNQYNNSPKALNRLDVYRDTRSLLFNAKVGLANV